MSTMETMGEDSPATLPRTGDELKVAEDEKPTSEERVTRVQGNEVDLMPEGLDPVQLKKAFNFAAYSSVILVSQCCYLSFSPPKFDSMVAPL